MAFSVTHFVKETHRKMLIHIKNLRTESILLIQASVVKMKGPEFVLLSLEMEKKKCVQKVVFRL